MIVKADSLFQTPFFLNLLQYNLLVLTNKFVQRSINRWQVYFLDFKDNQYFVPQDQSQWTVFFVIMFPLQFHTQNFYFVQSVIEFTIVCQGAKNPYDIAVKQSQYTFIPLFRQVLMKKISYLYRQCRFRFSGLGDSQTARYTKQIDNRVVITKLFLENALVEITSDNPL